MGMQKVNRRDFLAAAGALGGATLLGGCGSSGGSGGGSSSAGASSHPPISKESGKLSILEWGGYEAAGTKAQKSGLHAGADYTKEFGPGGITYTYIVNDDQSLQKSATSGPFDIMHPCNEMLPGFVQQGLIQPWDPDLLPSFKELNPYLVKQGQIDGKQYMIPWDWGYASLLYRTDKVDKADATGWELAWNEKYKGKISLWNGSASNFELTALKLGFPKMDDMTPDQINQAKQELIKQKPLNKFYWSSEYGQMQPAFKSGDIWITYSWQAAYVIMKGNKMQVAYLDPSQGRLSWFCGFTLGAKTENYHHAHKYVESFINRKAAAQMTNLFYYGSSNAKVKASDIKDQALAKELKITDPHAIEASNVHLQDFEPNRSQYEQAWQEVTAS
jgi:spermidine/putrescine transport system substrate-binding protein